MADNKLELARMTFDNVCKALDTIGFKYDKKEEEMKIECSARGDDLPMKLHFFVDAERSLVRVLSLLPFDTKEDKRVEMAVAVSMINDMLVDGSFDFDITEGSMFFRMTNSFIESVISHEVFIYMILCSLKTIDEYNDKLLMLSTGIIDLEKFTTVIAE